MDLVVTAAKHVLLVVIGLLPIMNPVSMAPLFLSLTRQGSAQFRQQQARKSALYAIAILVAFFLLGNGIIALFGISLAGIRIAGGLIVLVLAFRMLFSGDGEADTVKGGPDAIKRAEVDISFSPIAMPGLAGPGCIAIVMGYGSQIPADYQLLGYAVVLAGIVITGVIAWIVLAGADWLARFLGEHGIQAVTKIMGFLLACIAVQFIASGVREFAHSMG